MRLLLIVSFSLLLSCDACSSIRDKLSRNDTPTLPSAQAALIDYRGELADAAGGQVMAGFDVVVQAGDRLQITVESTAFDPVLIVTPPGRQAIQNDDWQGSRNLSRLDLTIEEAGVMKVGVSSFAPGARGAYHLVAQPAPTGDDLANITQIESAQIQGELAAPDSQLPDGRFIEHYQVPASPNQLQELSITSTEGAVPALTVTAADGSFISGQTPSRFLLTGSGPHHVQVMATSPNTPMRFQLSLQNASGTSPADSGRTHHAPPLGNEGEAVARGETRSGSLTDASPRLPTGEPYGLYLFNAEEANRPFTINLASNAIDTYLVVLGPNGRLWEDDDSGDGTGSRLTVTPSTPGAYRIVVSAYRSTERGEYSLKLMDSQRTLDAGGASALAPRPSQPSGGASLRRTGTLQAGDSQLQSGEFVDRYPFNWTAGEQVSIRLNSSEFDPYLILRMPDGQQLDNDDLTENDLQNSGLDHAVSTTGQHVVLVTSYSPSETGTYTLEINGAADRNPTASPTTGATASANHINGELETTDPRRSTGEFYDEHHLSWTAGERVNLRLTSNSFDTYLIVRPPEGEALENDDAQPGQTDAALSFVAPVTGRYTVIASSYRAGMQGSYTLHSDESASEAADTPPRPTPAEPSQDEPPPAEPNTEQLIRGTLASSDARLDSGEYRDTHELSLSPGSPVRLLLASSDFDPYLIVRTPSGQQLDNDDLSASTRNAGVDIPVAETGTYNVIVTSYRPGETGNYELQVGEGQAVTRPGSTTGGRVFGVFAGISDYPDGVGDLAECANDAVKLAETLRNRGLLTEDRQVVLTDAQASTANIRQAMQQMAQRVGPEDVFIFFFSGHGGQTNSSSDARELDGRDEFLVAHDGQILDDEVGRLLDGVTPRLSVVAVDSCHAGGLAKDVITRPGRIGLFSSEEDVLSAVASQFQAGGYLSHFLRTGMGGAADTEPQDGVLTVGELTHYLYSQFGAHAQDVHRAASYQHLVMDRGAVRVDHVMWSYR